MKYITEVAVDRGRNKRTKVESYYGECHNLTFGRAEYCPIQVEFYSAECTWYFLGQSGLKFVWFLITLDVYGNPVVKFVRFATDNEVFSTI